MQRSLAIAAMILGTVAVLALAGALRPLPAHVAFFVGSLAILLFPGAALAAMDQRTSQSLSLPEMLALWFALGTGTLAAAGFAGLALKTTVGYLALALALIFACFTVLTAARLILKRTNTAAARPLPAASRPAYIIMVVIVAVAVGCGLLTLVTPRDVDDWYYLAYIRDFVSDHAIRCEDAILGADEPASPRIWYASWWVAEAVISRATSTDPVATHQVYLPLLLVPFTVFAVFMLARQVLHSYAAAALGACLQVVFYLSSAYPYNSAGWLVFCRISQDKAIACFLMVPVVIALGLRFLHERGGHATPAPDADSITGSVSDAEQEDALQGREPVHGSLERRPGQSAQQQAAGGSFSSRRSFGIYLAALASAALVHPLSVVWAGVGLIPFALTEAVRRGRRTGWDTLVALALPLLASGLFLAAGMGDVSSELETKAARQTEEARQSVGTGEPAPFKHVRSLRETGQPLAGQLGAPDDRRRALRFYLPGRQLPWASDEGGFATVLRRQAVPLAANPLYVTRYPLAVLGLIMVFLLLRHVRRDPTARFLFTTTVAVLVFAFVPGCAALTAKALTWKLVYRLSWILPWGLTIAFFIARMRLRHIPAWVLAVALALGLARGNPDNYVKALRQWGPMLRPDREAAGVLDFLAREPAPQGVVIASPGISRMIPAFAADAYPAAYRGSGTITRAELEAITASADLNNEVMARIERSRARYILIEKTAPLSKALARGRSDLRLLYENGHYELWRAGPADTGTKLPHTSK